jgi:multidrug efflux pump subunit AcrB
VQSAIQAATGKFAERPAQSAQHYKTNPNDQAVIYIALTSDTLTDGELYRYATTEVSQRINILPGVSQVSIYGVQGAIRIKSIPARL